MGVPETFVVAESVVAGGDVVVRPSPMLEVILDATGYAFVEVCLEGNFVEAREVGPSLVLDHVAADLVIIVHLEGKDCLLRSANPVAVSKHCVEFPHEDVPVGHDTWRGLLDKKIAEPVCGRALEEG